MGAIHAKKGDSVELDKLTQLFMNPSEYSSEHWLIFGYHYYVLKKFDKASYFAHKACYLNPRNVEACLLKGNQTQTQSIRIHLIKRFKLL